MTREQITHVLTSTGNDYGLWTTLEGDFKYICLESDKNIYYYPQSVQFYFSPSADYFLLRYTTRSLPLLYTEGTLPDDYVLITHNGEQYSVKLDAGGSLDYSDDDAGIYHEIYSFDGISGMFYK